MKGQPQQFRAGQMHGKTAEKILGVIDSHGIGNNHGGQEDDAARRNRGVGADDIAGDLQALQFGKFDLAIDLRQRFKTAHRKYRVTKRDNDRRNRHRRPPGSLEPAQTLITEPKMRRSRRRWYLRRPAHQQSDRAPNQENHDH